MTTRRTATRQHSHHTWGSDEINEVMKKNKNTMKDLKSIHLKKDNTFDGTPGSDHVKIK